MNGRVRGGPRRVAVVTPAHFGPEGVVGGGERYPLNIARGLVAADPSVHVDLIGVGDSPRIEAVQPRLDLHVLEITMPGAWPFDHVSSGLVDALEPVDLVHVHQVFTRPSQLAILVTKLLGKSLVLTDHGAVTNRVNDSVQYVELADLMIFQSRFAEAQVRGGRRRIVIPGGVDTRFFRPPEHRAERTYVLFVGRLMPHKGIDRLLAALPPDVPCKVAGRPYDPGYARYVHALAATRDVEFVDDADDLALRELYRGALATVLPSVHRDSWGGAHQSPELMGLTALESMACGTPAIVSSAAALPEFVRDGHTGFVFRSLHELSARLAALATGEANADALGEAGRAMVEAEYAATVVGERMWRAYGEVLDEETRCGS